MKYGYQKLFGIKLLHEYFSDGICHGIKIQPTEKCAQLLRGHRLLFNPVAGGIEVLYPQEENKTKPPVMPAPDTLFAFQLVLTDPAFLNFTAINAGNGLINYFTNPKNQLSLAATAPRLFPGSFTYTFSSPAVAKIRFGLTGNSGRIIAAETIKKHQGVFEKIITGENTDAEIMQVTIRHKTKLLLREHILADTSLYAQKVFGLAAIRLPGFSKTNNAPDYTIRFSSKKDSWKYYLISAKPADDSQLVIEDKGGDEPGNRYAAIAFSFCERPCNRLHEGLKVRLFETGKMDRARFIRQEIPRYEEKKQNLQLVKYRKHETQTATHSRNKTKAGKKNAGKKNAGIPLLVNLPNPAVNNCSPELFIHL